MQKCRKKHILIYINILGNINLRNFGCSFDFWRKNFLHSRPFLEMIGKDGKISSYILKSKADVQNPFSDSCGDGNTM